MKYISLVIICMFVTKKLFPQQRTPIRLTGSVIDSAGVAIPEATIRLLSKSDTLQTVSSRNVRFSFSHIKENKLKLQINHLSYVQRELNITVPADTVYLDIGQLTLTIKVIQLDELQINKPPDVLFSGDTIHFETKHIPLEFFTRPARRENHCVCPLHGAYTVVFLDASMQKQVFNAFALFNNLFSQLFENVSL